MPAGSKSEGKCSESVSDPGRLYLAIRCVTGREVSCLQAMEQGQSVQDRSKEPFLAKGICGRLDGNVRQCANGGIAWLDIPPGRATAVREARKPLSLFALDTNLQ